MKQDWRGRNDVVPLASAGIITRLDRSSHPASYPASLYAALASRLDLGQHATPQQTADGADHEPVGQETTPDMGRGTQDMCLRDEAHSTLRGRLCHERQDQGCNRRIPVTEKRHRCVKTMQSVIRLPEGPFQPIGQTAIGLRQQGEVLELKRRC